MAKRTALSHVDASGAVKMVDVGGKPVVERTAVAEGRIAVSAAARRLVREGVTKKGHPLEIARIAGIQAAKRTADLIPLCHPLPLSGVEVTLEPDAAKACVSIESRVRVTARTGVEMEALTAVAVAGLTLYDMCKAIDRDMTIGAVRLMEKRGGRSGVYRRTGER